MVAKVVPEERKCLVCPETFLVGGSGNGRREKVFCSWACRSAAKINTNGQVCRALDIPTAAYLAGLIDADGHVALYGHRVKRDARRVWRPHLSMVNTDRPILRWVLKTTGVGSVQAQHRETERRKASFMWVATSNAAASTVQQILPYMRIKQERAQLLVDFWERCQDPVLKADLVWQEEYREQMLALNQRGPKH